MPQRPKSRTMLRIASALSASLRRTPLSGTVMRMRFFVIVTTRPAKEVGDFLSILLSHDDDSTAVVDTDDAGVRAEAAAASDASAGCYGQPEHVVVLAVVEPKHEFVQVERQILARYVVIGAENPALQQRPESFDTIRVNGAA